MPRAISTFFPLLILFFPRRPFRVAALPLAEDGLRAAEERLDAAERLLRETEEERLPFLSYSATTEEPLTTRFPPEPEERLLSCM
ncbi:MAG: hypothetical protein KH056_02830 [Clostridiales bacterium]|nr:hypothetical protein [Clostridiales bacterium]